MLSKVNSYSSDLFDKKIFQNTTPTEIKKHLERYLDKYKICFVRSQQIRYFRAFEKGLLSNLERKSIEPIALSFLEEKDVRGMQNFFTRSTGWDESLSRKYKKELSRHLTAPDGFLSVDGSDFAKKGKNSAGVARQYCGRLGKVENCQAGVFLSYATDNGIGLIDSHLYLPEAWFSDDYKDKRKECHIPEEITFKTKNEIAKEMVHDIIASHLFEIDCIGCDASFGSDHTFLDSLPEFVPYFVSVRENEYFFREMPLVMIPERASRRGRPCKHPRSEERPMYVKEIANDDTIPWMKRVIAEGTKGPIIAEIKCLRGVSCRTENNFLMPKSEIWLYIRRYENNKIKYFLSNKSNETDISELDRLATARWSIEQCFQECKSHLGMTHYETRSYQAWHRHMLFVMIAQLFVTRLRNFFKKKAQN